MKNVVFAGMLVCMALQSYCQSLTNNSQDFEKQKKSITLSSGITMYYIDKGNPAGVPLILLHGLTDTSRSFELMIDELLGINPDYRIIAPDLRGHGSTDMPKDLICKEEPEKCFAMQQFAQDVMELLDHLGISRVHLTGHSMGSIIAQSLVLKHPERFSSMVLIGTFVDGKVCEAIQGFLLNHLVENTWRPMLEKRPNFSWPANAYSLTPRDLGEEVETFLFENWVTEACADQNFLNSVFPETTSIRLGTWIGAIRTLATVDVRESLLNLRVPTLILWATQDVMMTAADQELVKAAFKKSAAINKTTVIYKTYGRLDPPEAGLPLSELGHNLHWAAPREVAADIDSFIVRGIPIYNRPYANPLNNKEVLTEQTSRGIMTLK
jgi:pimeloyl-ACP methyl ester carboxylesterase